jgi:hypothetical protein
MQAGVFLIRTDILKIALCLFRNGWQSADLAAPRNAIMVLKLVFTEILFKLLVVISDQFLDRDSTISCIDDSLKRPARRNVHPVPYSQHRWGAYPALVTKSLQAEFVLI